MSSSDLSRTPLSPSSFSEPKSDIIASECVVGCDTSIPDWSSSSLILQLETSFSVKSPKSPPQTLEEVVFEFEESSHEIRNVFSNLDIPENVEDDDMGSSIISQIQIDNSRNTSQDEEEVMVAISPNRLHNPTEGDILSLDPLSAASLSAHSKVIGDKECQDKVALEMNLPSNTKNIEESQETIDLLTGYLAKVANCQASSTSKILEKAMGTVKKLRQQSKGLMGTYAQLKNANHELTEKYTKLQSEKSQPGMTIEVLIPENKSQKPLNSSYLYESFSLDDDSIPMGMEEDISELVVCMDDSNEDYCDVLEVSDAKLLWPVTSDCPIGLSSCRLGCVCGSLQSTRKNLPSHCKNPACMFDAECTRSGDPAHRCYAEFSIMNGISNKDQKVRPRATRQLASKKQDFTRQKNQTKPVYEDPKLGQRCFVRLVKLNMDTINKEKSNKKSKASDRGKAKNKPIYTKPKLIRTNTKCGRTNIQRNAHNTTAKHLTEDWKLATKLSVPLIKIPVKSGFCYYCMEHQKRGCPCLVIL